MIRRLAALAALLTCAVPAAFAQAVENHNEDLASIALLFSEKDGPPTPGAEYLDYGKLDYSLESLKHVNEYLKKAREMKTIDRDWKKVTLRAGAYVGEVIRRGSRKSKPVWIDFETAKKLSPKFFTGGEDELGLVFVLYDGKDGFSFPIAKVQKFLANGPEDDVYSFASYLLRDETN